LLSTLKSTLKTIAYVREICKLKRPIFLIKRENEIKLSNLKLQQQFNQNIKQKEELEDLNHLKTSFFLLFLMIYTDSFYHKKEY
jgi:hypothetical protein